MILESVPEKGEGKNVNACFEPKKRFSLSSMA